MSLSLSAAAILEKNKLSGDGVWLILLEIAALEIRIVRNNDVIHWNGYDWYPFAFDMDDLSESSKGELPQLTVRISNVTKLLQAQIDALQGGVGHEVIIRVVHSNHLDLTTPETEMVFEIQSASADFDWVTFVLGSSAVLTRRIPNRRYMKDFCPFQYKGPECKATSALPGCAKTLKSCRERANSSRFGGEFSIPQSGMYASNSI